MMMRNDCISIIGKEKWNKLSVQEKANILDKSLHNQSIKIENPFIFSIKNAKIDNIIESFIDKPENNIIIDNDNNENTETLLIEYKPKEEVIETIEVIPDKIDIETKQEDIVPVTIDIEYTPMEDINKEIETHTETEIKDATSEVIEEVINNTETEKEVVETDLKEDIEVIYYTDIAGEQLNFKFIDKYVNKIKVIEQPIVEPNVWIPMDIKTDNQVIEEKSKEIEKVENETEVIEESEEINNPFNFTIE